MKAEGKTKPVAFDADRFRQEHRIHVKNGSFFTQDHYIVVHPRELDASNEARLTTKLIKHYTVPSPNFFSFEPRGSLAIQLAALIPISAKAKQESIAKQVLDIYQEEKTGRDVSLSEAMKRREAPFAALVRGYLEKHEHDPIAMEYAQHAMVVYLLLNEALRQRGHHDELAAYIPRVHSVDATLAQLEGKLGIGVREFSDIAAREGADGLAKRLGVGEAQLSEIRQIVAMAAANQFADNMVENWNVGRHVEGVADKSIVEKIQVGLMMRVRQKMDALREQRKSEDVPKDIAASEAMIVAVLRDLPPELVEMLYVSGTEFAYTPDPAIGNLDAEAGRALGFYRPASYDEGHEFGVRQIFVSARQSTQELRENIAHETHHLFFPKRFSVEQRTQIDELLEQGTRYMKGLKLLLDAWYEGAPEHRDAVMAEIDDRYCKPQGLKLHQVLGGMSMETLRDSVHDAVNNLDPHSPYLSKAAYHMPELRVAEIISRYAEMKYVRRKDFPQVLDFIAPHMKEVYKDYYLPHIRDQLAHIKEIQKDWPEHMQNLGVPPQQSPQLTEQVASTAKQLRYRDTPTAHVSSLAAEHVGMHRPIGGPDADIERIVGMHGHASL